MAVRAGFAASSPATATIFVTNGSIDTQLDLQGAQKVCPYTTVIVRVSGVNVRPPYYWTETHYRNGQPGFTGSFTTQAPKYAVSVDDETVDLTVTAQDICTSLNVAEAPRTITPNVDPNGGFYREPVQPARGPQPGRRLRGREHPARPGPARAAIAQPGQPPRVHRCACTTAGARSWSPAAPAMDSCA